VEDRAPSRRPHNHPSTGGVGDTGIELPVANFLELLQREVRRITLLKLSKKSLRGVSSAEIASIP
jgi:hypothetical protein